MWPQLARSWGQRCWLFWIGCPKSATLAQTRPKLIVLHTISTSEREVFDVATNPNPSERPLMWANVQKE